MDSIPLHTPALHIVPVWFMWYWGSDFNPGCPQVEAIGAAVCQVEVSGGMETWGGGGCKPSANITLSLMFQHYSIFYNHKPDWLREHLNELQTFNKHYFVPAWELCKPSANITLSLMFQHYSMISYNHKPNWL